VIARFEVDVATARPPRADATIYVVIEEPVDESLPLNRAIDSAIARAAETAANMAFARPQVVMPVAVRLVDLVEL